MITIAHITQGSKQHPVITEGKITRISNNTILFSIVGGAYGLYGDFEETFEVAIFDVETREFRTRFFHPEASDDVIPYMDAKDLVQLINRVIRKDDFQVI